MNNSVSTSTGGRKATSALIRGDYALSVGKPLDELKEGWSWLLLSDLARLESGHTPSRKHPEYWGGGIPWVGIRDATANHGRTIFQTNQFTNEAGIVNSSARILPANTVCLSRTASVGYVIVMGVPMSTSQDFVNWVCDPERLDYRYLKYILLLERRSFLRFASGTTHQTIYFPEVKAFHVKIPEMEMQSNIANILTALDDKIELNRQTNKTLEAMAQALFKSWFVDFDPVIDNALSASNDIPEPFKARAAARQALSDARKPLPDEIRREFPDGFEFRDEMGWVPSGWDIVSTESIAEKIAMGPFGSNIKVSTFVDSGVPIISGQHLHNSLLLDRENRFITEEHALRLKNSMVRRGDIVFTHAGNIGQVSLVPEQSEYENYVISQRQFYLRPDLEKIGSFYLLLFFKSAAGQHKLLSNTSQVGVPSISRPSTHLKKILLPLPTLSISKAFDKLIGSIFEKVAKTGDQTNVLVSTRDTLLPKLLSGQLTIPDAEKLVADAI